MKNKFSYIITSLLLLLMSCAPTTVISNNEGKSVKLNHSTFVDVRSPEQFNESPVKNAVNIPLSEIKNNLDFFRSQKHSILYCNSGRQTGEAFEILKNNGIKNIDNIQTWKNAYTMQNNFLNQLVFNKEKPSTFVIKKTDKVQQIAVGLGEGTLLKKHITPVPTNFTMVKGEVIFKINNEDYHFAEGDVYEIPVNVEHEVIGRGKENVFILTKEL